MARTEHEQHAAVGRRCDTALVDSRAGCATASASGASEPAGPPPGAYAATMPGLEAPDEIDVIAEDADGSALLSIIQTGAWSKDGSERGRLKRKLAVYLRYALEGQMVAAYPSLEGRPVVIALMYEEQPPQALLDYWRRRGETAARDGVTLKTQALGDTVWRA